MALVPLRPDRRKSSAADAFNAFMDTPARLRLLRGLFESCHGASDARVIVDTNGRSTARTVLPMRLYPEAPVISWRRPASWGHPLNPLEEACFDTWSERLMPVSYARLCTRREEILGGIYRFLGLAPFAASPPPLLFSGDDSPALPPIDGAEPRLTRSSAG